MSESRRIRGFSQHEPVPGRKRRRSPSFKCSFVRNRMEFLVASQSRASAGSMRGRCGGGRFSGGGGGDRWRAWRRVKILGGMSDEQFQRFAQFMEVERAPQWSTIVKQGDPGDTMYLILQGELRVRINVMGKETILTTLGVGDFFGDISLFDQGPRSADVVANNDSVLLKISSSAFEDLSKKAPELATPFLRNIGRTMSARIRADNKRLSDAVRLS